MALYTSDSEQQWKAWGSGVYSNGFVQNASFDVTLLCSDRYIITFLQPLQDKYDVAVRHYRAGGLTRWETHDVCLGDPVWPATATFSGACPSPGQHCERI